MGTIQSYQIEFHGELFRTRCSTGESYITIDGSRYNILPNTLDKFEYATNAKEYIESIEEFAACVLITHEIENDGFFELI